MSSARHGYQHECGDRARVHRECSFFSKKCFLLLVCGTLSVLAEQCRDGLSGVPVSGCCGIRGRRCHRDGSERRLQRRPRKKVTHQMKKQCGEDFVLVVGLLLCLLSCGFFSAKGGCSDGRERRLHRKCTAKLAPEGVTGELWYNKPPVRLELNRAATVYRIGERCYHCGGAFCAGGPVEASRGQSANLQFRSIQFFFFAPLSQSTIHLTRLSVILLSTHILTTHCFLHLIEG